MSAVVRPHTPTAAPRRREGARRPVSSGGPESFTRPVSWPPRRRLRDERTAVKTRFCRYRGDSSCD